VPVAILLGLSVERLFMGQTLAALTTELVQSPEANPEALMAAALGDPSLKIAYQRPGRRTHVDASGAELTIPTDDPDRAVVWIERRGRRVAAVIHDATLSDQARFLQAAGAAATMHLERVQLDAHLSATNRKLAASRVHVMDAADAERRRIERDLHDGVQQQLVGLRIKLDLIAEAVEEEPARRMLFALGRQMDGSIDSLRALARGIYPSVLTDHGLVPALRSAARGAPMPVSVRARKLGRFRENVEVAVYFCCLEALQNIVKHAGPDPHAVMHLWETDSDLHFEVSDCGKGFASATVQEGHGLVNMRDRIDAIGGRLSVTSSEQDGTSVSASVAVVSAGSGDR
jgi:signal transduction histidine kinase